MALERAGEPLREAELPDPVPREGELLLRVRACGVCRTDLHIVDGELTQPKLPLVPGHQIVGEVVAGPRAGERVGVPWLGWTCGTCRYCTSGAENLCDRARDGEELLALAPRVPLRVEVETFPLARANEALGRLRGGDVRGTAVLTV